MSIATLRRPSDETEGLYPGLVVCDDRVTGSVTIGPSRLPVWAIPLKFDASGWDYMEDDYGVSERDLADFAYHLFQARGELGRLLLLIADCERREQHNGREMGGKAATKRLVAQIHRVLDALDNGAERSPSAERTEPELTQAAADRSSEAVQANKGKVTSDSP